MTMEQIKLFFEKAQSDSELAAKYSALTSVDAILKQAQSDGFDVTREDVEAAVGQLGKQPGELSESDLAAVAGGKREPPPPCPECESTNIYCAGNAGFRCRNCNYIWNPNQ